MKRVTVVYQMDAWSGAGHYSRSNLICELLSSLGFETYLMSFNDLKEWIKDQAFCSVDYLVFDVVNPLAVDHLLEFVLFQRVFYITDMDISKHISDSRAVFFFQSWSVSPLQDSRLFSGPRYLLVDPLIRGRMKDSGGIEGRTKSTLNILVSMGSRDTNNMNVDIMSRVLTSQSCHHYHFLLSSSSNSTHRLVEMSANAAFVDCYVDLEWPAVLDLYTSSDVSFGGCGISLHEKLLLGLRSVVVPQSQIEELKLEGFPGGSIVSVLSRDEFLATDLDMLSSQFFGLELRVDFERYKSIFCFNGAKNIVSEIAKTLR